MIEQQLYWRRDLRNFAERLEKRYRQKNWSDRTRYNIEKEIQISINLEILLILSALLLERELNSQLTQLTRIHLGGRLRH